jgi:hypothetical protein
MRSLLLTLLCVSSLALTAQEQAPPQKGPRTHEIGLRLTSLDDFDFIYRRSITNNSYRRYRIFAVDIDYLDNDSQTLSAIGAGFSIGKERRKSVVENFNFIYGPEFSLSLAYRHNEIQAGPASQSETQYRVSPGLGYVLGFTYLVSDRFHIGIETIPSLSVGYTNREEGDEVRVSAGFNSNAIALTAVYRFTK